MKTLLLFLLSITSIFFNMYGQNGFHSNIITTASDAIDYPTVIASGDIDGDGDIDLISASQTDRKIAWYTNLDGNGLFARPTVIDNNVYSVVNLYLVDIDNDADLDILVASERYNEDKIFVFENTDGLGNFAPKRLIYNHVSDGQRMAINHSDLDGDGDQDILCVTTGDNNSRWFENVNGAFTENFIAHFTYSPSIISAADITGDDILDLVIGSYADDSMFFYEGLNNNVEFGSERLISNDVDFLQQYHTVDINGDGDLDIVAVYDNRTSWFENLDGRGNFGNRRIIESSFFQIGCSPIDVDMDGDLDIVVASYRIDEMTWHENLDGMGTFGPKNIINPDFDYATLIIAADLNGDGFIEPVVATRTDQSIDWFPNLNGTGTFDKRQAVVAIADLPWMTDSIDLDGDGLKDVLSAIYYGEKIVWYKNLDNEGLFSSQKIIRTNLEYCTYAKAFDIDGDGDPDILGNSSNSLFWIENMDGFGNFETIHDIDSETARSKVCWFKDFNNDGRLDIISSMNSGEVAWYENLDNAGNFGDRQIATDGGNANNSYVADLDMDGDLDVVSCYSDNNVTIFKNNGGGIFDSEIQIETALYFPYNITVADVDGDNDNDLIVSDFERTVWYKNLDGLGSFSAEFNIDAENQSDHLELSDLDADGDLDLVTTNWELQKVVWYKNLDGDGNFSSLKQIGSGSLNFNIDDINNDGVLDIIAPFGNGNRITWFENLGLLTTQENLTDYFIIFPNPTKNLLNILSPKAPFTTIEIFDIAGRKVLSENYESLNNTQMDISKLAAAAYFLTVNTVEGQITKKLIKE